MSLRGTRLKIAPFIALYVSCAAVLAQAANGAQAAGVPATPQLAPTPYIIRQLDTVSLSFALATELNEIVQVQADGAISLIAAGSVKIAGLTRFEAEQVVRQAYVNVLRNPMVSVDLRDWQHPVFTVLGQVNHPGQYDLRRDLTIVEALAVSGGLTNTSRTQVLLYNKVAEGRYTVRSYDLHAMLKATSKNEQPVLAPGDLVFVPEKVIVNFRKYVPYGLGFSVSPLQGFY